MQHVATAAGVTAATVSLSLNNSPRISTVTREKIHRIAEKLGYQRNPYVSALMRTRRQGKPLMHQPIVAMVCAMNDPAGWRQSPSATIRQMRDGAIERAAMRGYQAQDFWLHQDGMSNERFSDILRARGIGAVLLSPAADGAPTPALIWDYFSAVSLSVPFRNLTLPTVCNDHYFSSLLATRECYNRGYRRPGIALRTAHRERFHGRWEAGFLAAQRTLPGITRIEPFLEGENPVAFLSWVKREKPDVIISPNIDEVEAALKKAPGKFARKIGLASLSCPELGSRHSGVHQNGRLIGATAMDLVISMAERHEHGLPAQAITSMVEGIWNEGKTLRPLKAAASSS